MNENLPDKIIQLNETAKKTLVALLTYKNKTNAAKSLNITRDTLYKRIQKYGLDKIIVKIPEEALQILQLASVKAAEVLVDYLEMPGQQMAAAKEILDRVGLCKKQPVIAQQFNTGEEMKVECIEDIPEEQLDEYIK